MTSRQWYLKIDDLVLVTQENLPVNTIPFGLLLETFITELLLPTFFAVVHFQQLTDLEVFFYDSAGSRGSSIMTENPCVFFLFYLFHRSSFFFLFYLLQLSSSFHAQRIEAVLYFGILNGGVPLNLIC